MLSEIDPEGGEGAGEFPEQSGKHPRGPALARVGVPTVGFQEGDLDTDISLDQLRDLGKASRQRCRRVDRARRRCLGFVGKGRKDLRGLERLLHGTSEQVIARTLHAGCG